jgi:lipopolysaccharide/colanic/teichoic acid biosynthesis glycosyltransferase
MIKRTFDIIVSFLGLVVMTPLLLLLAVVIKLDSPGPIFFRQERIGRGFRPFFIFKFRTMVQNLSDQGRLITVGDDPRVTRVGRLLRKSKFDELPQLINVLKGDMSLVGPRPEVRRYVELFRKDYEQILKVRPGITDLASLKYHDEASVLERFENPEAEYCNRILPDKISLSKEYVNKSSFLYDLALIVKTFPKIFGRSSARMMFFRDSA